jgi:hypothetical protein
VVASPKSGLWWVSWIQVCMWFILAPKVFQLCTNQLVIWFCANPWVIKCLSFCLVPSRSSSMLLYPSKCYELGSVPRLFALSLFSLHTHIWIYQGPWECVHAPTPCPSVVFTLWIHSWNNQRSWGWIKNWGHHPDYMHLWTRRWIKSKRIIPSPSRNSC